LDDHAARGGIEIGENRYRHNASVTSD
jgi:hypothetical protein